MPDLDERPLQDMDKWLSTFAEVDRPQALLKITQSAYSNDLKERAYIRLCKLENAPIHRRRWALFKASLDETEPAVDVLLQGGAQTQNDSESQFLLGRLYTALSRYGDADQAYVRASALNPGKALYFEGLAYVNTRSGNYERALAAYEKIIELTPDQAYAYMSMAEVNLSAGQAHEAVNNYAKAADLLFMSKDVQALQKIVEKQASIRTTDVSADPLTRQLTDKVQALLKELEKKL
jgi:tetratricopeptide (TPR) repeat protein